MKAIDMGIDLADDASASREHAAQVFADARRRQLELALAGRTEESAAFAEVAATARGLLDELHAIEIEREGDEIDLDARREAMSRR